MLHLVLADEDLLTTLGRIAALVLVIYVFLFALLFFVGSMLLLYANSWVRDKVVLLHRLRSIVESFDIAIHAPPNKPLPASYESETRFDQVIQAIHTAQAVQVVEKAKNAQKQVSSIEKTVEPVADRIAEGVIEFRARTVMAQGMLKAFFVPGLVKLKPSGTLLLPKPVESERPIEAEVSIESSSLEESPPMIVVTQVDPSDKNDHASVVHETERFESEGTE